MSDEKIEDQIMRRVVDRVVVEFIDWIIMVKLSTSQQSGYDILKYVLDRYQIVLSPGTVYSAIYTLQRKGYVECVSTEGKRIYALTEKGKEVMKTLHQSTKFKAFMHKFVSLELQVDNLPKQAVQIDA